jgi:hypothetical protein
MDEKFAWHKNTAIQTFLYADLLGKIFEAMTKGIIRG